MVKQPFEETHHPPLGLPDFMKRFPDLGKFSLDLVFVQCVHRRPAFPQSRASRPARLSVCATLVRAQLLCSQSRKASRPEASPARTDRKSVV